METVLNLALENKRNGNLERKRISFTQMECSHPLTSTHCSRERARQHELERGIRRDDDRGLRDDRLRPAGRGDRLELASLGSRGRLIDAWLPCPGDGVGERACDPERVHVQAPSNRSELLYRVASCRGSRGRDPRDAIQRRLPPPRQVDLRHTPVQIVVNLRRALLHGEHTESVRHRPRPILGDHRPHQLRAETHPEESSGYHSRGVDPVGRDQLAPSGRLERLARGAGTGHTLPIDQKAGIRDLLLARLLLHPVAVDEPRLPRDISGHEETAEGARQAEQNKRCPVDEASRGGRRRGIGELGDESQREVDPSIAREAVVDRRRADRGDDRRRWHHVLEADDGQQGTGDHDNGLPIHRGEAEDLVVEGETSREDIGRDNGRVRRVLATVLSNVRDRPLLPRLLPLGSNGLLHHVARLREQRSEPAHLHHLQPRLQEGIQKVVAHSLNSVCQRLLLYLLRNCGKQDLPARSRHRPGYIGIPLGPAWDWSSRKTATKKRRLEFG